MNRYRVSKPLGAEVVEAESCHVKDGGVLVFMSGDRLVKAFARHAWLYVEPEG